ncbi:MAG: phytanoyl-CoA dioxygenase family protein [Pseudomonadota bacterium]
MDAKRLINFDRYPIDHDKTARNALLDQVRVDLARDGCAVIKGFLSPEGITALQAEAENVKTKGHRSFNRTNVYFTADDPSLPVHDPRRRFYDRSNSFISADNFPVGSPLRSIFDHPTFDPLIKDCLQEDAFFRYADPLADVVINMAEAGNGFPWHFDTNNFTVTLAIQNAEGGGAFQYAPNIRKEGENFEEVARVLDETSNNVKTLHLEPGDLQLFKGRYSLHRVAPLEGKTSRYVAIFSYVDQPDMVATPERCKQLYGKVLPIHYARAGLRNDAFID